MPESRPWHEDNAFWETWGQTMFGRQRLAATTAEVDSIISLLGIKPDDSVLDLCCGVGRHALELARRGFEVTGVDRTRQYLEQASRQADEEGLKVEFIEADMREFSRPAAFGAVINIFTSFGYFEDPEDDRRVIRNMCSSLKPGGRFLIDMHGKESLARIFRERDWTEVDGGIWLQERRVTKNWSWMEGHWILLKGNERTEGKISHRLYSATEIMALMVECDFSSVEAYGTLDGGLYDHTARRLVVVGRK